MAREKEKILSGLGRGMQHQDQKSSFVSAIAATTAQAVLSAAG